MKKFPETTF